jgi:hypothetical protein
MEGVERIKNLNVRGFCAQGIVSADGIIPTFTVWFQQEGSHRTVLNGSVAARSSSYRYGS